MQAYDIYKEWLLNPYFDEETKAELRAIEHDTKEIEDRFFQDLAFGTGGLRGVLGAGTNRMNIYVVRRATQGLANYIVSLRSRFASRGVVIAFDSRHLSPEFAQEAACVLASSGIKVYLYRNLRPVPQLSFSVRHLHACAGIMITASHNPAEYNGYKVYWEDGAQIANEQAKAIMAAIDKVPGYDSVGVCSLSEGGDQGLIIWLDEKIDGAFYSAVLQQSIRVNEIRTIAENYPIVYTPLHGTGNLPVRHVLRELGFKTIHVVPEQELPDPLFSTVTSPNPEDPKAFALALQLAEQTHAQLIIATDPDCDRVGVMVRNREGQFTMLTGNQTGALLTNYILQGLQEIRSLPKNGMLITTIVTGLLVLAAYCLYAFNPVRLQALTSGDLKPWAVSMLIFIGIGVGASIIIQIIFHILMSISIAIKEKMQNMECDDKVIEKTIGTEMIEDERDKLIELKSLRVGFEQAAVDTQGALFAFEPAAGLAVRTAGGDFDAVGVLVNGLEGLGRLEQTLGIPCG